MEQEQKTGIFTAEIRLRDVPKSNKEKLDNIADNIGITTSALLKSKLPDIIKSYPESYHKKRED